MKKRNTDSNTLTHREILGRVIRNFEGNGFTRYRVSTGYFLINGAIFVPDCTFHKPGEKFVDAIEVKSGDVGSGEIARGIGQCIAYLALGFRPFLAITEKYLDYLLLLSQNVPQLGIICCYRNEAVIANNPILTETSATRRILETILHPSTNTDPSTFVTAMSALRRIKDTNSKPEPGSSIWNLIHDHKLVGKSIDEFDV